VTALEPGARFGYRPIKGPLQTNNLYTFETRDEGTLVTLTDDIALSGAFKVFQPLMPPLVRSGYRKKPRWLEGRARGRAGPADQRVRVAPADPSNEPSRNPAA
jgi:hypothetical protein